METIITIGINRIFLVDVENVGSSFLDKINYITDTDKIIIFETSKSLKISFETALNMQKYMNRMEVIKVKNGTPNATDFTISTMLGALIEKASNITYIIVSKDKGYESIIHFWRRYGIKICMQDNIDCNNVYSEENIEFNKKRLNYMIDWHTKENVQAIAEIILKYETINDAESELNKHIRINKVEKLDTLNKEWDLFKHVQVLENININNNTQQ